jgi:mannose-1-phosphate guanylyltransferase/phosphomannomutase
MSGLSAALVIGGKGSRLSAINPDLPKCLFPFMGRSILDIQLDFLKSNGVRKVHLFLGHLNSPIIRHLKNRISEFEFVYHIETEPRGTVGNLLLKVDSLSDFTLVLLGDLYLDFPLTQFIDTFVESDADFQLLVHPSSHMADSDLVQSNSSNRIVKILKKPRPDDMLVRNQANAGVYIFRKSVLKNYQEKVWSGKGRLDLDGDLIPDLLDRGAHGIVFRNLGLVKDLGTPDRIQTTVGLVKNGHSNVIKPMVFLDRDGVINFDSGWISRLSDFKILDGVPQSIAMLNTYGYRVCVVTNQPVIARGDATIETVEGIHHYLDSELSNSGAYVDEYFVCAHHPESGFEGEIPHLKVSCSCRKPGTGLFEEALKRFPTDLSKSFVVGDSWRDEKAANSIGIQFLGISGDLTHTFDTKNVFDSLNNAVDFILGSHGQVS